MKNTSGLQFLPVKIDNLEEFVLISAKTFRQTFEANHDLVDFEKYMGQAFNQTQLKQFLDDPGYYAWFANNGTKNIGYFTLREKSPSNRALSSVKPVEIERFYLEQSYQGHGFGRQMMNFALESVKFRGSDTVWLSVWEKNTRAIEFYKKCGFEMIGQHTWAEGECLDSDFLMLKQL